MQGLKRRIEHHWIRHLARRQAACAARTPPDPEIVLVAEPFGIGDTICALPAVRALRNTFPAARLVLLTGGPVAPLVAELPFVDAAAVCPRSAPTLRSFQREWRPYASRMLAVLLNDGWWPNRALLGLVPRWCCGYRDRARFDPAYHPARQVTASWKPEAETGVDRATHLVRRALHAAAPATGEVPPAQVGEGVPELARPEALADIERPLAWESAPRADRVLLQPGTRGATKRWPETRWSELARALRKRGAVILLTGSQAEREEVGRIAQAAGGDGVHTMAGLSLAALAALAAEAGVMVAPDCGPAHIASAVGCATVVLMGPTRPETSAPFWGLRAVVAQPAEEDGPPSATSAAGASSGTLSAIGVRDVLPAVEHVRAALRR